MRKYYKYLLIIVVIFIIGGIINKINLIVNENRKITFPNKPIKLIVPYKEGGGTDINAKFLAKSMENCYGIKINIEYMPSEIGEMGYKKICDSTPDGYTLGFLNIPNFFNFNMKEAIFYNKDSIIPIMNFSYDPCVFVVKNDSEFKRIEEFIQKAKANPSKITISNNGIGTSNHIAAEDFSNQVGIKVTNVPFNGSNDMLKALHDNYVNASVAKLSEVSSDINEGKFKILAAFTEVKLKAFPQVPTLKEKGYEVFHGSYRAIIAPKGLDKEIVDKLYSMMSNCLNTDYSKEEAAKSNIIINNKNTEELKKLIKDEEERIKKLNMKLGI